MSDLFSWIGAIAAAVFPWVGDEQEMVFSGYIEPDFVYVAPTATRRLTALSVAEGAIVTEGQPLFEMDAKAEAAALAAAIAARAAAEATLHNLETGSRDEEIAVTRAALEEAEANASLARTTLTRSEDLFVKGFVSQATLDSDRSKLAVAEAAEAQLRARLTVAELPARDAEIAAARANVDAASAEVEAAQAGLSELIVEAPAGGVVDKIYFDVGEVAAAGTPVVSILPPGALTILFYVPETERMDLAIGTELGLSCDGCAEGLHARVTRLASDPQYTPPMIYSREERTRMVFRAEAELIGEAHLLPGQPVTLEPLE